MILCTVRSLATFSPTYIFVYYSASQRVQYPKQSEVVS